MIANFDTIEFGKDMMIDAHSTKVQICIATSYTNCQNFSFYFIARSSLVIFSRYVLLFDYVSDAKKLLQYFQLLVNAQKKYVKRILYKKVTFAQKMRMTFQIGKKCKLTQLIGVKRMNLFKCFLDSHAHLINWSILVK